MNREATWETIGSLILFMMGVLTRHINQSTPYAPQIRRLYCWETGGAQTGRGNWKEPNTAHSLNPAALQ
jgi:hypothetical protein